MTVTLPDGTTKPLPAGSTGMDIALEIGRRLAREAVAIKIDGKAVDLSAPLTADCTAEIITFDSPEGKEIFWHSASHIMAHAIEELFPGSKFGAGPAIEQGFYYDIASEHRFTEEDLRAIEERMLLIAGRDIPIVREEMPRIQAIEYFRTVREDPYKVEILTDTLKETETVSLYHEGGFTDLCSGPHLFSTAALKAVKLFNISASYWRGDQSRESMQRIYGIAFPTEKLLKAHLSALEEAKNAITANSVLSWSSSCSRPKSAAVYPSGFPKEPSSARSLNHSSKRSSAGAATCRSIRPTLVT